MSIMATEIEDWGQALKYVEDRPKYKSVKEARDFLNADPDTVEAAHTHHIKWEAHQHAF